MSTARLALALLAVSCTSHPLGAVDPQPEQETVLYQDLKPRDLDMLFVIDDSPSMADKQDNLTRNFPRLIDVLKDIPGGLPNVHIAVVSSDLGAGPTPLSMECQPGGAGGRFRGAGTCGLDPEATFMASQAGGTLDNFSGDISAVFSCLARLGERGCGIEHPLQAARVALSRPENRAFLRKDAFLAVIILTDEDDCSAPPDTSLFHGLSGQAANLSCTLAGHLCQGRMPPAEPFRAPLSECEANPAGALIPVDEIAAFIRGLKENPSERILVSAVAGWAEDEAAAEYRIDRSAGLGQELELQPICYSRALNPAGVPWRARAALRVRRLVESFGRNGTFHSVCADDFRPAMQEIGERLREILKPRCLPVPPVDIRPDQPGLQPDCQVIESAAGLDGVQTSVVLPSCEARGAPCWRVVADSACSSSRSVEIDRGGAPSPSGGRLSIHCRTCVSPDDPGCGP